METKVKTYWIGAPGTCQMCGGAFSKHFVDGRTYTGQWANMCTACHKRNGVGLGTGKGQKYEFERETGKYFKIEG